MMSGVTYVVVADDGAPRDGADGAHLALVDVADDGVQGRRSRVRPVDLPAAVAAREAAGSVRWVWDDTARRYPPLLAAGVRVERCHDLRLAHALLRRSARCAATALATDPPDGWDRMSPHVARHEGPPGEATLFDVGPVGPDPLDPVAELARQLDAVGGATDPGRLRLLVAAESTGALIAAEMHHDGMPWDVAAHDALLTSLLGPRPPLGARPERLEALAGEIRALLHAPALNPDSQPDLLRALRSAGVPVESTRQWELAAVEHPVVAPLLEYKKLARLLGAHGWAWAEQWVRGGRFRPEYVPAGVVSGRWATSGGGALQLPGAVRGAVRADPGWRLVVADAAQLEPRVLAAMSGDEAMAAAGRRADLYAGLVDAGVVQTREQAKSAMLGAIYGATSGRSGALMPRLTAAYPRAVGLVEAAARAGERGEQVSTWLGRTSPPPSEAWQADRAAATGEGADAGQVQAARRRARDRGRFTRNFVVQGTAAEWALCWLASLRRRLRALPGGAHLVLFLHDEVVVHTPAEAADDVAVAVREAAVEAGRLLFGDGPVDFPLSVSVVGSYDQAK